MKIAFVALPRLEDIQTTRIAPPLPLGYIAALLEQQRHIVRIYDLALARRLPLTSALAPLRAFRPHLVVIASSSPMAAAQIEAALASLESTILHLGISLREPVPGQAVAQALWRLDARQPRRDEQTVIFEALLALDDDLDSLPFPARHLLPLEQYPLFTPAGELQTTVLVAQQLAPSDAIPRQPALVIAELQTVIQEHGIRHFVFPGTSAMRGGAALNDLLERLEGSGLGASWEAAARPGELDAAQLRRFRRAGCEALGVELTAADVLSRDTRAALTETVVRAHEQGIAVRAHICLESPYESITSLVDISATFGIDAAHFTIRRAAELPHERAVAGGLTLEDVAEMARTRYRSSRSRQFFIERFGPQLGPMLWRVGRAGLLGRTWRRYASGGEDGLVPA